jgi:hypothetical protein
MPPLQSLVEEDFVDATPLDRDPFLLIEVSSQSIECPTPEGQAEALRIGQGGGDNLGTLLSGVGVRTPGPSPVLQPVQSQLVEPMDPGIDRGATDAQVLGDLAGPLSRGDGQEEPSPLDEVGLSGAGGGQTFEDPTFLRGQLTERDMGAYHRCTSFGAKATSLLRQTTDVSSLAGCTT